MSEASQSQQPGMWTETELPRQPQPLPSEPEPPRPPRLQPVNRNQLLWHAVDVEKLVGPDHLVRAIWELVGQLDLKGYTAEVGSVEGVAGRPAYDPRLLISLWIYAYSQKVGWAREVARRCEYDPAFQWLTGMEVVNYHTLADFRVQHEKALDELFAQLLGVLSSEGLISLERVVHDGTKVKASASGNSFHREKTLRGHLEAARERVREMGDPRQEESSRGAAARERAAREKVERLERALKEMEKVQAAPEAQAEKSEQRVSETEPEARNMKQSDGGYAPSHNVQISTDTTHGIIVGASVTQAANDQHELVPAIEEIERQTGRQPEHLVVDEGYTTRENVLAAAEKGVDLIGSAMQPDAQATTRRLEQRGVAPAFYPDQFPYDAATNTYTCPAGKQLPYQTTKHDRVGVERKVYKARAADCRNCVFRQQCCPGAQGRRIVRSENVPVVAVPRTRDGQDAQRSGAGPLSLARSHGGVFESLAEDQARAAAVWRARLAEGPL
ncbi:MAG: IS1182 family transposase [Terriglobia bacterium]